VTLRRKTLVIIGATLLGLLVGFFVLTRFTLLRRFRKYEDVQTRQQVQRVSTVLENELSQLSTIVHDNAEWDEAYDFVQHPNQRFLESNYPAPLFTELRINLLEYLNLTGQVVFQRLADPALPQATIPPEIQKELVRPDLLVRPHAADTVVSGIMVFPGGPMMMVALPVRKSSGEGPVQGALIIGRNLDANEVHRLSLLTHLDVQIYSVNDPQLPEDFRAVRTWLSRLTPIVSRPLNDKFIRGYQLLYDLEGRPALIMGVRVPRTIYEEGKNTELYLMTSALALGFVFSAVMVFLLERLVLSRLVGLGKDVAAIGTRGDLSARVGTEGNDELSDLSRMINRMLADLEQATQERRRDEERYRAYIDQSTEGIWRCEMEKPLPITLPETEQLQHLQQNLYFAECNEALARLHGFTDPNQMRGLPMRDLFDLAEPMNLELARKFVTSAYRTTDSESIERDQRGSARYFLNNVSGVVENGFLIRVWGAQREITEHRRLESQLRHAQKMEAIGRLAGGVAHDFNNLLSVIHGYTEILLRRFPPHSREHKEADQVLHATERAASLTQQLLAFGRKQVLEPRILNLNSVVCDMEHMLRRLVREDIDLTILTDPDLWLVRADSAQMEQVLVNLAVNASDAILSGGRVTLQTRNVELDESVARQDPALLPGQYVMLAVSDTGIGMDTETRARIFEPFFTTKEVGKGTGLGLASVYGIVRQSGGQISVYSEPGQGSVFRIYLPRVQGKADPVAPSLALRPTPAATGTVLLVEDDASVRRLGEEVLKDRGYAVISASSGQEALQLVENGTKIDLLVTDVIMPGMAGDELVEHLRLRRPDLKVVFVSGYASDSIPRIIINSQTSFLQKPFPVEELVRKVYDMIHAN
jgi:signal transduction histidine kinase/sensor domain CHASE-containing protein